MNNLKADASRTREPIRKRWIWPVLILIVLAGVPWYLPQGTIRPVIFGVPFWLLLSVGFAVLFSAILSWICTRHWNLVEDQEDSERAGEE